MDILVWLKCILQHSKFQVAFKSREVLRLQQFYNIFITNYGWLIIIGSNLNLALILLF